ncbi:DUF547 domain-containing protein [Fluviispira multicolorata]|uniref:DUF547 domain-containing protein n=1 Tax=Fluviispira multicolorata TaxID=2654512 RepID=A0A833JD69_9BACT|nr:DUF547 domain-containing protein [Fluviispira multicolorata]KAB8030972.1 DUF547 domain-containing protein [Fluviispira multicolorata]
MKNILIMLQLFFCISATANSLKEIDYSSYQKVLSKYVIIKNENTFVDYKRLKDNPVELNKFLKNISEIKEKDYLTFNSNEKLAFLINAYNALTLKLIIDNYPIKSIRDIGGVISANPWKKNYFNLLEKYHNLDEIEHDIIRKNFQEPRIHFALVCASKGCPNLLKQVFRPETLQKQLQKTAEEFLANKNKNYYSEKDNKLFLSSIFKWYGDDFKKNFGSFNNFIMNNIPNNEKIKNGNFKIEFLEYDWSLNDI